MAADLEGRLAELELSPQRGPLITALVGALRATIPPFVSAVISEFDKRGEEFRRRKVELLLARYIRLAEDNAAAVRRLFGFLNDPRGHALFTKILQILDNELPDDVYTELLARLLHRCVGSDFVALFDRHRFVLGVVAQLTIQQLRILADCEQWPGPFRPAGAIGVVGGEVRGIWHEGWASRYGPAKDLDETHRARVAHAVHDLQTRRLVTVGQVSPSKEFLVHVLPSEIGAEIQEYLHVTRDR